MALSIRQVNYFYVTVKDQPGAAYQLLSQLAQAEVNLLAFGAVPMGPERAQLTLFPRDEDRLEAMARRTGLQLDGPHPALLVQGDDQLGALAQVHAKLFEANIDVWAANGVTDGHGGYGYLLYVRPKDVAAAVAALGL